MDEDVLIAGDDRKAKDDVADADRRIPGLRPVDCGELEIARIIEQLTPLLISVNKRHKIKHSGIRLTGLDRTPSRAWSSCSQAAPAARSSPAGLLDLLGPDRLAVIANTGDDIAAFGLHVSPDPDLVTYWLAGVIDEERGYGIAGESFNTFDQLVELGGAGVVPARRPDLATCLMRTELLHEGERLTEIARAIADGFGVGAAVLPMCDEPVQTYVRTEGEWRHFQEYLILQHAEAAARGRRVPRRRRRRTLSDEVRRAIDGRRGDRDRALQPDREHRADPRRARACARRSWTPDAPVVAVSPLVGGHSLKGPTEAFLAWAGLEVADRGDRRLTTRARRRAGRRQRLARRAAPRCPAWSCTRPTPLMADARGARARRPRNARICAIARRLTPARATPPRRRVCVERRARSSDPARQALRRRKAAPRRGARRRQPRGARRGDVLGRGRARSNARRCSRRSSSSRASRQVRRRRRRARRDPDRRRLPRRGSPMPPAPGSRAPRRSASSAPRWCPSDCPLLEPGELEELFVRGRRRRGRGDRAGPPRHRHERARRRPVGPVRAAVRPGLAAQRHVEQAERRRLSLQRRARRSSLTLDVDTRRRPRRARDRARALSRPRAADAGRPSADRAHAQLPDRRGLSQR